MKLTGDIEDVVFHEVAGTPAPASDEVRVVLLRK